MNKNIWINIDQVNELGLTFDEYLTLLSIRYNKTAIIPPFIEKGGELLEILSKKEKIIVNKNGIFLKKGTIDIIKSMNANKGIKKLDKEFVNNFRKKFRGLRLGAMGSFNSCYNKLARWRKENPEYSESDVLKAVDVYIHSLAGKYDYLQRADYFIYKREGKEENSRLSSFIEEIETDITDDDWTSNLN